jgi:hypothetical protein
MTCRPSAASPARALIRESPAQYSPAAAVGGQRGEQELPQPCAPARAEVPGPQRYRGKRATGPAGSCVIVVLAVFTGRCPGPRDHQIHRPHIRAALLAGRTCQASGGVMPPASADSAGADVGLAERYRVFIPPDAGSDLAPDHGPSDLVTQNRTLGDGDRTAERVALYPPGRSGGPGCALVPGPGNPGVRPRGPGRHASRSGMLGDGFYPHAGLPSIGPARPTRWPGRLSPEPGTAESARCQDSTHSQSAVPLGRVTANAPAEPLVVWRAIEDSGRQVVARFTATGSSRPTSR